jgi:Zn-dependent protease with chaperone function
MTDAQITQLLQQAIGHDSLRLQVKQQDMQLLIMINRPADLELDYDVLSQWFAAAVPTLPQAYFKTLVLYGRVLGQQQAEWSTQIALAVPNTAAATPATSEIPAAAPSPTVSENASPPQPEPLDLSQYCFTSNLMMLTTSLPTPAAEVAKAVWDFHQFSEDQKRQLLPLLSRFFKAPEKTAFESLSPELQGWLAEIKPLKDQLLRSVAIWLSRYCVNPDQALAEIGDNPTARPAAQPSAKALSTTSETIPYDPALHQLSKLAATEAGSKAWVGAGRSLRVGVPLQVASFAGNLAMASGVSLTLLAGMVLVLCMALAASLSGSFSLTTLLLGIGATIAFNLLIFFISPFLMDLTQQWLYGTNWVNIHTVQRYSPEAATVIQRVCAQYKIPEPRLGIIEDENPTAFTYGSLPSTARLVVSKGLFTYLSEEEIATVYAHELGHIVHWDFAIMTLAATLVQICYLIYSFITDHVKGDSKNAKAIRNIGLMAYIFYLIGTYIMLYLSRVREYFADHFAAEVTGNPNGLSRALVKIAYGIVAVSEGQSSHATSGSQRTPNRLLEGTRALGIYDHQAAAGTATAYHIAANSHEVGRVFLWDLFNPWAWWMELNSTHPLTGKRVRALSTYAEQLGLETEFAMARVVAEGNHLDRKRLYGSFVLDVALMNAPLIGVMIGLLLGIPSYGLGTAQAFLIPCGALLLCGGVGLLVQTAVMYPSIRQAPAMTVLKAMSNPYASPLRGTPLQLEGQVIGRGEAGYRFGSDMKLQDPTGLIYLRYASRFGSLGNFLFGASQVIKLIGQKGKAVGWFRRGVSPWVDLMQISTARGDVVKSYHAFWNSVLGLVGIIMGIVLMVL